MGLVLAACTGGLGDEDGGGGSGASGPGSGPGGAGPSAGGGPVEVTCEHEGNGTDYAVGPGQPYASLNDVPSELLQGGDTIRLFYREEPYREKLMLGGKGTPDQPIRLCGVPGPDGELPVLDGDGATTRPQADFPYDGHQARGVLVVGHRNGDPYEEMPGPFVIEGVAVRGGRPTNQFVDVNGSTQSYSEAVGGIFVQRGEGITIRGCQVYDNANGLFVGTSGGEEGTYDVLIEANYVGGNGTPGSDRQHNVYNEASGVTHQFNVYAPLHPDALGTNIKERSAGVVIRYNFVHSGSHLLDIVDAQEAKAWNVGLPEFHETWVYGNVLWRPGLSGSAVHYGGDSEEYEDYRKGTLYFFHNTLFVDNAGQGDYDYQALFELSTNDEYAWSRNNVFHASSPLTDYAPMLFLGPRDGVTSGVLDSEGDWVVAGTTGWYQIPGEQENFVGELAGLVTMPPGADPLFLDVAEGDFRPGPGSPLIGAGVPIASELPVEHQPDLAYAMHYGSTVRSDQSAPIQGALLPVD